MQTDSPHNNTPKFSDETYSTWVVALQIYRENKINRKRILFNVEASTNSLQDLKSLHSDRETLLALQQAGCDLIG